MRMADDLPLPKHYYEKNVLQPNDWAQENGAGRLNGLQLNEAPSQAVFGAGPPTFPATFP